MTPSTPATTPASAIAAELRRRRQLLGISQSEASRRTGVSRTEIEDGVEVRLVPLPVAARAVVAVTTVEPVGELSEEQVAVLCLVAYHGAATRREIERMRGQDSERLLRRLVERGLLDKAADEASPGGPNVYRVTARALAATGHTTLESLQAYLAQAVDGRGAMALSAQELGSGGVHAAGLTPEGPVAAAPADEPAA